MITKRKGHGQTICKGCKDKGKFGLNWDSFLYNFNDEPYCFECLMETLEIYQDRINKAIKYIEDNFEKEYGKSKEELKKYNLKNCTYEASLVVLGILKGGNNE